VAIISCELILDTYEQLTTQANEQNFIKTEHDIKSWSEMGHPFSI